LGIDIFGEGNFPLVSDPDVNTNRSLIIPVQYPNMASDNDGASFLKLYSNLPLTERTQPIVVLDNQPISWEIARNEVIHDTARSKAILKKLKELKII